MSFTKWASVLILTGLVGAQSKLPELVRTAAWGAETERDAALTEIRTRKVSNEQFAEAERALRRGRAYAKPTEKSKRLEVTIDGGRKLRVDVQWPADYDPKRAYPLMVAMGGGPVPSLGHAQRQGQIMAMIWRAPAQKSKWLVATITDSVSIVAQRSPLRYPMLQDVHFKAVLDAVGRSFHVDTDRVHATGVSLGSNYSLHYAAGHPHWFAGVVPVSTEGESREWVLRNVNRVCVYVLEGVRDRNIRDIAGPRKLKQILESLGTPHVYVEDPNRGHESFRERYPQVLSWLAKHPRDPFPSKVIRTAHRGILMPAKRFYWVAADTHQAIFEASADRKKNEISVKVARAEQLTFYLSDQLVDLGRSLTVRVNGRVVHEGEVPRSLVVAVEDLRATHDPKRFATARLEVKVPSSKAGEAWVATLSPKVQPAPLAYWEMFALDTLKDNAREFPAKLEADADGVQVVSAPKGSGLLAGDRLLAVDGEPMFGASSIAFLRSWLVRRSKQRVTCKVRRGKSIVDLVVDL
jgi:hypothetical protein